VADFDINELCDRADVTPRTVHFYVQQGLLPPAGSPGPGARYREGHVSRIRLIRLLQKQHLPLAEIAKRIRGLSDEQIEDLVAETKQRRADNKGSALDYIRSVLTDAAPLLSAPPGEHRRWAHITDTSTALPAQTAPARSQWERYTLADGMELHVRRPMSRVEQKQLDKLMAAAREIFDKERED
jgi:DNA-binding transcriptional MerR regulator